MLDTTGYTYAHEHLHIDLSGNKHDLDCKLDQYALICEELRILKQKGVANIVEVTNRYMGRNPAFLLSLMQETGINIIAATGYYQQAFFPTEVQEFTIEQLAQVMIAEIEEGIDGTSLKAGVIAEIGSSLGCITADEEKVFQATVLAYQATGRPISTHTSLSTMGVEQVKLLKKLGMDLQHVVIGHCDLTDNLTNILTMLDHGVYVQFDTIGKNSYYPDSQRVAMLLQLSQRGLLDRVMLSMDITRRSHLQANGGLGFSYLLDTFVPMLGEAGIPSGKIKQMLQDNPNKFFQ